MPELQGVPALYRPENPNVLIPGYLFSMNMEQEIRINELHPFRNHPYYVKDDDSMHALCDSILEYGILSPLLTRTTGEEYEIVSGHRRRSAAMKLGLEKLPVLVRAITDDEAIILMVASNIQRENLLHSVPIR